MQHPSAHPLRPPFVSTTGRRSVRRPRATPPLAAVCCDDAVRRACAPRCARPIGELSSPVPEDPSRRGANSSTASRRIDNWCLTSAQLAVAPCRCCGPSTPRCPPDGKAYAPTSRLLGPATTTRRTQIARTSFHTRPAHRGRGEDTLTLPGSTPDERGALRLCPPTTRHASVTNYSLSRSPKVPWVPSPFRCPSGRFGILPISLDANEAGCETNPIGTGLRVRSWKGLQPQVARNANTAFAPDCKPYPYVNATTSGPCQRRRALAWCRATQHDHTGVSASFITSLAALEGLVNVMVSDTSPNFYACSRASRVRPP